ncbi:serine hydrolase [Dyella dinghuensis]|uniref:serine hydrolase n=1 Tax=Dyella dinghuensis TaxID=1920169 RepID=UPI0013155188|nr:serine hydrolase domain-containing protein [Dyella dinghuensis]
MFAKWNRSDTPGAAVEVIKDGKVVYRRAFRMADIEQGRPVTPSTTFHVASLLEIESLPSSKALDG